MGLVNTYRLAEEYEDRITNIGTQGVPSSTLIISDIRNTPPSIPKYSNIRNASPSAFKSSHQLKYVFPWFWWIRTGWPTSNENRIANKGSQDIPSSIPKSYSSIRGIPAPVSRSLHRLKHALHLFYRSKLYHSKYTLHRFQWYTNRLADEYESRMSMLDTSRAALPTTPTVPDCEVGTPILFLLHGHTAVCEWIESSRSFSTFNTCGFHFSVRNSWFSCDISTRPFKARRILLRSMQTSRTGYLRAIFFFPVVVEASYPFLPPLVLFHCNTAVCEWTENLCSFFTLNAPKRMGFRIAEFHF